jgi:hypothetical protein
LAVSIFRKKEREKPKCGKVRFLIAVLFKIQAFEDVLGLLYPEHKGTTVFETSVTIYQSTVRRPESSRHTSLSLLDKTNLLSTQPDAVALESTLTSHWTDSY